MMKNKFIIAIAITTFVLVLFLSGCFLTPSKLFSPELLYPNNKASNVSTNVVLQWKDPNSNSNFDTYKIYFGISTPLSYLNNSTETYFAIGNLKYSTTYFWKISLVNKEGKIATSDTWHFTTEALPKPSTPVLSFTSVSTDSVSLEWSKSTNAASITLYSATSSQFSQVVTLPSTATSYTVTELKPSTTYKFFVVTSNTSGIATSNTVTATTQSIPTPPKPVLPSTPVLSVTSVSTNSVSLEWSKSANASAIDIYSATSAQFKQVVSLSPDATSYTANGLKPSITYKFFAVGVNPAGRATSNTVATTTRDLPKILPSTPTLKVTSISTRAITLQWSKSNNASSITICQATTGVFSPKKTLTGIATSYVAQDLIPNTTYRYFVIASNPAGRATSNIVVATTLKVVIKPLAPKVSVNSPNTYSAVLTWTDVSTNVSGFHIWRRSSSNKAYTLIASVNGSTNSYTDIVNPGHNYSYLVSAYNSAGQSFSRSASVFVGQNYFPMKDSNSLAVVNAQPLAISSSAQTLKNNAASLLSVVKTIKTNGSDVHLIPTSEVITSQKITSNGITTYTVNIPCAFVGQADANLALTFVIESGRVYIQNFAPYPILFLNSAYGDKPSSKMATLLLKPTGIHVLSNSYSRSTEYISQMAFGNHTYKNVLKVALRSPSMTLVFYLAPTEGLMSVEILSNSSLVFSYTVDSTSTNVPLSYPQAPVITSPSNNSTLPSTLTLKFSGSSNTYTVYLNSQTLISTSSTVVEIGPLSDGNYDLVVKAGNSYGLETLGNAVNFTIQGGWTATPTYVVGDFTNWATNSNYKMNYDSVSKTYSLAVNVPAPSSTLTYGVNRYMIEQVYKGKVIEYGCHPIPVTSGSVTFYFNQPMAKPFTSLGIGDTSKQNRSFYFAGDLNDWKFNQMKLEGTTFVATIATSGVFLPATYGFKITPQEAFSTAPASLMPYYFNGSYDAYYLPDGNISVATPSNTIVVKFDVLNSQVSIEATNVTSVYLRGSFSSWAANKSEYKFKYDPLNDIYTLTTNVPSPTNGCQEYKVIYNNDWYGGNNIPVKPGTVTFYFDPENNGGNSSAFGIGDTSKASMAWYYRGDFYFSPTNWGAATMTYVGNGTFAATFTGNFQVGDYGFKIAPNDDWSSSPYYYNGSVWRGNKDSIGNGTLHLSVAASEVMVEFNVLKSLVALHPVISSTYYVVGNFNSWATNTDYKMTPNASGIYTLTATLGSTTGQYQYKVAEWDGTQTIWYGGNNIPVKPGNVAFYFDPNNNGGNTSAFGIGDTTKESMGWYFASNLNSWKFATMTYIGNGIFAATLTRFATNDSAGVYEYKISPQPVFSTNPASLTQYYFNGGYGGYSGLNGILIVPKATTVVVDFNVLNSSVSAKAVKVQKLHQVIMAFLDSLDEVHATLNSPVNTSDLSQFSFTVNGEDIPISSVVDANTGLPGISSHITMTLSRSLSPSDVASSMVLGIDGFASDTVYARYALNDPVFHYDGQLGAIWTQYQTTFKVWSPVSNEVNLLLFRNADDITPYATYTMMKDAQGVWSVSIMGDLSNMYYEYSYHQYDRWVTAPDIYSKGANANNTKSMVVALSQTDPGGWDSDITPFPANMVDAIIYELHVQDFTDNPNSGISPQYQGTYMGFTQVGTNYDGIPTGIDHLSQLGINYVQLLPIEDYEDPQNQGYNWGYVPYLYMVPEPKYSTTPNEPANTINEVKCMIEALHSKDIGVILDISFSHTSYVTTPYEAAVPYYYYNYDEYGQKTNYSGVGNDLKTGNYMVEKLMIDTLEYWMKEYHISGFRFDQMYLYNPVTIQDIVKNLRFANPGILLYGEPWPANGYQFTYGDQRGMDLGVFNGYFRDAIVGKADSSSDKGFVNGNFGGSNVQNIKSGVVGSVPHENFSNTFALDPDETINYATCHDNYALWDKIKGAQPTWSASQDIAAQKFAGAIVMLSQGVAFMQGGAEFARTKNGNGNSYNVQEPNEFDWERLTQFATVNSYYQGLIAIRKSHPAFRMTSAQEIRNKLTFLSSGLPSGTIGYEINGADVGDAWSDILVYFNGNTNSEEVDLPSGTWNMAMDGKNVALNGSSLGSISGTILLAPLSAYVFYK